MAQFTPAASAPFRFTLTIQPCLGGSDPAHPGLQTHIEAASFRGKITYFETVYPWDQRLRQEQLPDTRGHRVLTFLLIAVLMTTMIIEAWLARQIFAPVAVIGAGNAVSFGDFHTAMLVWLFNEHHTGVLAREFDLFIFISLRDLFLQYFIAALSGARTFVRGVGHSDHWLEPSVGW